MSRGALYLLGPCRFPRFQLERGPPKTNILPDPGREEPTESLASWKPLWGEEVGMQGSKQGQVTGFGDVRRATEVRRDMEVRKAEKGSWESPQQPLKRH